MIIVAELRAEVENVKAVMDANISKVIERGERLDDLEELSESLNSQAVMFQVHTHTHTHTHTHLLSSVHTVPAYIHVYI